MMRMCEKTGKWLYDEEALEQTITRILRTPKGAQVCNRDFGSELFNFIDMPVFEARAHISHEIFKALAEFIPEFEVKKLDFVEGDSWLSVEISGNYARKKIKIFTRV